MFESSPFRRFFFEFILPFPSVAAVPSEGIAALLVPADELAFVPNENVGVVAESEGALEVVVELLPKENPGVVAWTVVEAAAELLPKEKAGALCLASLSFVVELGKLKPLFVSVSPLFCFWPGSVMETFADSCFEVEFLSLFVPKLNLGAWVELDPGVDEAAKLPNN